MPLLMASAPLLSQKLQAAMTSAGLSDPTHPLCKTYYDTLAQVLLEHIDTALQSGIRLDFATTNTVGTAAPGQATAGSPAAQATVAPGIVTGQGTLITGIASVI